MSYGHPNSNEEVARAFNRGEAASHGRLTSIPITSDHTILVGYGHAVYAMRYETGKVVLYTGWLGKSQTTSEHLGLVDDYATMEDAHSPTVAEFLEKFFKDDVPTHVMVDSGP